MMNHHSSHRLPIRSSSFLRHRRQEDNSPIFYFWRRFVVCIFVVILSEVGIFGSRSGSSSDRSRNQHLLDTEPNHHHHPARGSSSLFASAFSSQDPQSSKPATRVLVTGAAGKTGRIILRKLEDDPRYEPKALVRTENSARDLIKSDDVKCPLAHVVIADITSPTFLEDLPKLHHQGLDSLEAMIICTSAVPRISKVSLIRAVLKAPFNMIRRKPIVDFRSLQFKWKNGGYPELVDYQGQVAQIELAKMLGIKHVVVVSSMGGTDPNNFLNSVGKSKKDGSGNGDILLWKRRAEKYLVESGLDYTIIHPGGLVDTPGGKEEFVLDVDDNLYQGPNRSTRISREDLADLCIASLSIVAREDSTKKKYRANGQIPQRRVSFDCITRPVPSVNGDTNDGTIPSRKSAEEALLDFLELSKTANYAL